MCAVFIDRISLETNTGVFSRFGGCMKLVLKTTGHNLTSRLFLIPVCGQNGVQLKKNRMVSQTENINESMG